MQGSVRIAATLAILWLVLALAHHGWLRHHQDRLRETHLLKVATAVAAALDASPELPRTHAILQRLAATQAMEAFIVAPGPPGGRGEGPDNVRASARDSENGQDWSAVAGRVTQAWPAVDVVRVPLHRDPAAPQKTTGALLLAAPAAPPPPSLMPSAGIALAAVAASALALLLVGGRKPAPSAASSPGVAEIPAESESPVAVEPEPEPGRPMEPVPEPEVPVEPESEPEVPVEPEPEPVIHLEPEPEPVIPVEPESAAAIPAPPSSPPPGGAERRRHPRVACRLTVRYERLRGDRWVEGEAAVEAVNKAVGGLRLRLPQAIDVGTRLRLVVDLPDGPLRAAARVVWLRAETNDAGIEFDALSEKDCERLMTALDALEAAAD